MDYDYMQIVSEINKKGYCLIDKFWDDDLDIEIQEFFKNNLISLKSKAKIDKFGNKCFSIADKEINKNPFDKIQNSKTFIDLYKNIFKINNLNLPNEADVHNVISYAENHKNLNNFHSTELHFDAFYLTIIIPIKRSKDNSPNSSGRLTIFPNIRNFSTNSIKNYLIKIIIQNKIVRFLFGTKIFKKIFNFKTISININQILLFYGYRSLHGNEALKNNNVKVNAIFHIYNPHKNSIIDKYIFKRNKKIRFKKLNN